MRRITTQRYTIQYKLALLTRFAPPQNEQLLKEALQFSLSGHQPPSIIILYHSHCAVFQQVFMHIIDFFWYFFLHKFRKSIIVQHPPPISLNHHSWRQPPSPIVE